MTITQRRHSGVIDLRLTEEEAERLGNLLYQIASHTPDPRDDVKTTLERALWDVLDISERKRLSVQTQERHVNDPSRWRR